MANTNRERQVQQVVFKGQRSSMAYALSKFIAWGVQMDMIVTEVNVTSIYVQAPQAAMAALHKALVVDGLGDYYGNH